MLVATGFSPLKKRNVFVNPEGVQCLANTCLPAGRELQDVQGSDPPAKVLYGGQAQQASKRVTNVG